MRRPALPLSRLVPAAIALVIVGAVANRVLHRRPDAPPHKSLAPACPKGTALVPAGRFIVAERYDTGSADAFCMDVTEVTVAAYANCVAANACLEPDAYAEDDREDRRACNWKRPGAELHPVNCVDWAEATAYCAWANQRLPTEEEWEWAARGGLDARKYPWGAAEPAADRLNACGAECVAWAQSNLGKTWSSMYTTDDGWPTTAPVGSFPAGATALGLLDMAGNVWEWTSSSFDTRTRVTRGGGWSDYKADRVRVSHRGGDLPTNRTRSLGFRCAG